MEVARLNIICSNHASEFRFLVSYYDGFVNFEFDSKLLHLQPPFPGLFYHN